MHLVPICKVVAVSSIALLLQQWHIESLQLRSTHYNVNSGQIHFSYTVITYLLLDGCWHGSKYGNESIL